MEDYAVRCNDNDDESAPFQVKERKKEISLKDTVLNLECIQQTPSNIYIIVSCNFSLNNITVI